MPQALAEPEPAPSPAAQRPARRRIRLVRPLSWLAILGLVALNAWWLWDDRPMPSPRQVEPWIRIERQPGNRPVAWWDVSRDNAGARVVLRRAVRRSPNDPEARLLLGRALGASGDVLGCARQLHLVPHWSPLKTEALLGEGMAWLELNRARDAESAFLALLAVDPNHPERHGSRAFRETRVFVENKLLDVYALEDRWDEARALAWRAYRDASGSIDTQRRIVEILMRTRLERSHPAATLATLRPIVAADPGDWHARLALARAADGMKDFDLADREIARCLKERPNDPHAWGDRLEMLERREDFKTLAAEEKLIPSVAEADGRIWLIRGRLLTQKKDRAGAAQAFRRAVELLPNDVAAQHSLAMSLQRLDRSDEAKPHFERHNTLKNLTSEIPMLINHYKDVTEVERPNRDEVADAMRKLSTACQGIGWNEEAAAWAKLAKGY